MNQHKLQKQIKEIVKLRLPVYICGPTGCGKTFLSKLIAEELNLPFYKKLIGAQMTESSLLGYNDAHGKYVEGICFRPYTEGGLLILDEIDNGNANTNLVVNGLCDEEIAFPIGMKSRHKNFCIIATANTTGSGATLEYVGRNRLDAAMLNRFVFINVDYDYDLERKLANDVFRSTLGRKELTSNEEKKLEGSLIDFWLLRQVINELQLKHILSQRNLIQQTTMLAGGIAGNEILEAVILRNLDKETKDKIKSESEKIALDAFKKKIAMQSETDLITKERREKILEQVDKEAQKALDAKINELENKIRVVELSRLQALKMNESLKLKEVKDKLTEKEKELRSIEAENEILKNKETEKELHEKIKKAQDSVKGKGPLNMPNWDDIIMGNTDDKTLY